MFLENQDDNEIINFDEYAPNPIFPDIVEKDNKATTREKIVKNEQFLKNLGQNAAFYSDDRKIDINQFQIENRQPLQEKNNIIIPNMNQNDDDESVIQFQEIADFEENQIENINTTPKNQQSTIQQNNQNQEQINQQEHNSNEDISQQAVIPQVQNSIVSNASIIPAYPLVNKNIEFIQTKEFLTSPIQENGIVQCQLLVNASGLNRLSPKFYLERNGKIYLAAKHDSNKFIISMNKDKISRDSSSFIGLISCEKKYDYYLYDNGFNPKKKKLPVRTQLGHVKFPVQQKLSEPRQQEVRFPLSSAYYVNRKPKWNEKSQCFTLNFYDRVKISSIKNFQLIKADEIPEQIYVQFGKIEEYKFNLDFSAPFSPLLAFMIALINYDKKIEY